MNSTANFNLFPDRKKNDVIRHELKNNLSQKTKIEDEKKGNLSKDTKTIKKDKNIQSNDTLPQEYNQLNIITINHSVFFILFLSLLIGLSLNTLLSFVFPIYTELSFKDQIPSDLNIHGFNIGPAYFDGVVREVNHTKYINIEIPSGLTIDLDENSDEFYVSTQDTILFTNSEDLDKTPSFLNMETQLVQSIPLNISDNTFKFRADKLIIDNPFQVMGKINCKSLIYNGYIFNDDGTCTNADTTNLHQITNSKSIKSFLQNLKIVDDFGFVNNFTINYPYIAISNDNEMRIYKYDNDVQYLIGSVSGKGNLYKNLNSNVFNFGQNSYRITSTKIEKIDFNQDLDYENETVDNDGNKLAISYNKTGIYYNQYDGISYKPQKSLLLYSFTSDQDYQKMNSFDLKISFDQFGSPVVTSNSLRMVFLIENDNESFENLIIDFDEENNIDDIRMLSYSNQLLYLSNHTLSRYLI